MVGGEGSNLYIMDSTTDIIIEEQGGVSSDTVQSSVTYSLSDWLNNLTLTGNSGISGYGNSLDNTITGNKADNYLFASDGNNVVYGGAGADFLDG